MKKILTTLAIMTMAVTSWADTATEVKYIDAEGDEQTCASATVVTSATGQVNWTEGWYVVQGTDVTITNGVTCMGDVHLILADGAKLTIGTTTESSAALRVGGDTDHTLEIFGQANNTGTLIAETSANCSSGIGGSGTALIINGGTIQATGGPKGAGIGTGQYQQFGTITINGGRVTATGGESGSGIGCSVGTQSICGTITINGGNINATGNTDGAGIGAGSTGVCETITINGGSVYAASGKSDVKAINAQKHANSEFSTGTLNLSNGLYVYSDAEAIPTTLIYDENTAFSWDHVKQYAKISTVKALYTKYIDASGAQQICTDATIVTSSESHITWAPGWYLVKKGTDITLGDGVDCTNDGINNKVHLILEDNSRLTINTTTNGRTALWIGDGDELQIYGQTNNTGTLAATSSSMGCAGIGGLGTALVINGGTIQANGGSWAAGIGSGMQQAFGTITINGGNVTAVGGAQAPGIGSGAGGVCGSIAINGGSVTASSASSGYPAIGKGDGGTCSSIVVNTNLYVYAGSAADPSTQVKNDGTDLSNSLTQQYVLVSPEPKFTYIDAYGNQQVCTAASVVTSSTGHVILNAGWHVVLGSDITIADGVDCNGDVHLILTDGAKLTIGTTTENRTAFWVGEGNTLEICGQTKNTGTLIATSPDYCAGIGGRGKALVINGGTIIAKGGLHAAGIGSGCGATEDFGTITINGGNITAEGQQQASGIGCGYLSVCGRITINGGNITATGGASGNNVTFSAIGEGNGGTCNVILVNNNLAVRTGSTANPTTYLNNNGSNFRGQFDRYALVGDDYLTTTRSTAKGKYGTICLPQTYTVTGAKLYSATYNQAKNCVELDEVSTPAAGKPYIYQATADEQQFTLASGKFAVTEPVEASPLVGVFAATTVPVGSYVMQTQSDVQAFYPVENGSQPSLSAYKAYLTRIPSNPRKSIRIGLEEDEETAIDSLTPTPSTGDGVIYNLAGQRISKLQKGVNIVNGVKVLVK